MPKLTPLPFIYTFRPVSISDNFAKDPATPESELEPEESVTWDTGRGPTPFMSQNQPKAHTAPKGVPTGGPIMQNQKEDRNSRHRHSHARSSATEAGVPYAAEIPNNFDQPEVDFLGVTAEEYLGGDGPGHNHANGREEPEGYYPAIRELNLPEEVCEAHLKILDRDYLHSVETAKRSAMLEIVTAATSTMSNVRMTLAVDGSNRDAEVRSHIDRFVALAEGVKEVHFHTNQALFDLRVSQVWKRNQE
ncbi:hypothetical protein BJ508DRAFT_335725 [Ascobolus immersus RN42]|uniref:Uncharacterized protein n=1 Tax=Ascobolus immersus RN42 TaxID=1160509 RepID=A0A3N4HB96_ASCIM|nr:hypothetical protein BJ508DRAFT_335725 [Ascobolus immersus RN42]